MCATAEEELGRDIDRKRMRGAEERTRKKPRGEESCQFALETPRTRSRLVAVLDECVCALGNLARVVGVVELVYTCSDTSLCVCALVTNHTRVLEMTA